MKMTLSDRTSPTPLDVAIITEDDETHVRIGLYHMPMKDFDAMIAFVRDNTVRPSGAATSSNQLALPLHT